MLLDKLRVRREIAGRQPKLKYDAARQISKVFENGRWVESWRSSTIAATKKADVETGEDQKGT